MGFEYFTKSESCHVATFKILILYESIVEKVSLMFSQRRSPKQKKSNLPAEPYKKKYGFSNLKDKTWVSLTFIVLAAAAAAAAAKGQLIPTPKSQTEEIQCASGTL